MITKGMIFAGCSFTWGQGLYYYSNMSTLREPPPDQYDHTLVSYAQKEYMKSKRFSRLVANKFNSFELVYPLNGGSHESIIRYWDAALFTKQEKVDSIPVNHIDVEEVSFLCFQLTQPHRCKIILDGEPRQHCDAIRFHRKDLKRWMKKQGLLDLDDYTNWYQKNSVESVKFFLQKVEDIGIPTMCLSWPQENVAYIDQDDWLKDRFLKINYKGKNYTNMFDLMLENSELIINSDNKNFKNPPKDHHPSKLCHEVVANNIINYITDKDLL